MIAIAKAANPTSLPAGGGSVTYSYTVTNPGNQPLTGVTVTDDKCSPVTYVSGDANSNSILEVGETWHYTCTTTIADTTTNTATATGHADGNEIKATAQATVTVAAAPPTSQPSPTPTVKPSGSVAAVTSPPKPRLTLPPTDQIGSNGSSGSGGGMATILMILAGLAAFAAVSLKVSRKAQSQR